MKMFAFVGLLVVQTFLLYHVDGCAVSLEGPLRVCDRTCGDSLDESGNATTASYNETSPKCACGDMCSEFGECCYYSPRVKAESGQLFDFVCASAAGTRRYSAVNTCPEDRDQSQCAGSLNELRPVTSIVTGTTYGNVFCAWCNGETEGLEGWDEDWKCIPEPVDYRGSYDTPSYVENEWYTVYKLRLGKDLCQFHVRGGDPLFPVDLTLRACNAVPMVSRCPAAWDDAPVAERCGSYVNPVLHNGTVYRNPECAECHFVNLSYVPCDPPSKKRKTPLVQRVTRSSAS